MLVAIASHEPTVREVDGDLVHRSSVVVESRHSVAREAGDLIIAGTDPDQRTTLAELLAGARPSPTCPRFFKSTGMAWDDTVVTSAILAASPITD